MGIQGRFFKLLLSMYSNVKACVQSNNGLTPTFRCSKGVKQGCNLSPLLFSLFINDIEAYLNNSTYSGIRISGINISCLIYADDLVVLSTNPICLQKLLNALNDYCNENDLTINMDKSKTMVFRRGGYLSIVMIGGIYKNVDLKMSIATIIF